MIGIRRTAIAGVAAWALFIATQFALAWEVVDSEGEGSFAMGAQFTVQDPSRLELRVMFGADKPESPTSYHLLTVHQGKASFSRVENGAETPLGIPGDLPGMQPGDKVELSLHRGAWRMACIIGGRVITRAFDSTPGGPVIAYEAPAGVQVQDTWVQPVGEIEADDTFERTEEEEAEQARWEALSGKWELISLREDRQAGQMQADKTTNAFSYFGTSEGPGLARLGDWFWRNCEYSLAARSRGTDTVFGLAFYVQDAENYLLLRWDNRFTADPGGAYLRLDAVVDGKVETLAQRPGGHFPDQWYRLTVRVCDERIFCYVDGQFMLEGASPLFGQGPVGLYVDGKDGAWFDDMHVHHWGNLVEEFDAEEPGKWLSSSGNWTIAKGFATPVGQGVNRLSTGPADWSDYSVTARVKGSAASCGLSVAHTGPIASTLFRWSAPGKAQIVQIAEDGSESVLAEAPIAEGLPAEYTASVVVEAGYIAGLLGGRRIVDCIPPRPLSGGVGLYAERPEGIGFESLRVDPLPERTMARITKEFTDEKEHFEMVEWASTRHNWIKPEDNANPAIWWTKGDYYGPLDIRFTLQQIGQTEGTLELRFTPDRGAEDDGYRVTIAGKKGSQQLAVALLRGEEKLASGEFAAAGAESEISVERRGNFLTVSADGEPVLEYRLPDGE